MDARRPAPTSSSRKQVGHVVVGCVDPFAKVSGRGIRKLLDAGIHVKVGVLGRECEELNRRFIVFNTHHRPYVLLKWAQSSDGYIGDGHSRTPISTPFTTMLSHRLRAEADAILIGRRTLETDHPQLNVRQWSGPSPERVVLSRSLSAVPEGFVLAASIDEALEHLWQEEMAVPHRGGGSRDLRAFIEAENGTRLGWETAPLLLGSCPRPDCRILSQAAQP